MEPFEAGVMRCLSFFEAIGYAPTHAEAVAHWDVGGESQVIHEGCEDGIETALLGLVANGMLEEHRGRIVPGGRADMAADHERRERFFPRKIRRARNVARWLSRLGGVRFVALCNTTALAHAEDAGDLDFFVIVKTGALWQTRLAAVLPFLSSRPRSGRTVQDAVCLSFFADDSALDLAPLMLPGDDPYFRHWFFSLLPLFDDGVSADLWRANSAIMRRHPVASAWIVSPDLKIPNAVGKIPSRPSWEIAAKRLQERRWPEAIRSAMNRDTHVVVNDHILKFHVEDGRENVRRLYGAHCQKYGVVA